MQFATLDYRNKDNLGFGWGDGSNFVIKKEKCMRDGFINIGDSGVTHFPNLQGRYREFPSKLIEDDKLGVDFLKEKLGGDEWIEVNLANGINIPDDIEEFVVNLWDIKEYIKKLGGGEEKTDEEELLKRAKNQMKDWYGEDKVKFIDKEVVLIPL